MSLTFETFKTMERHLLKGVIIPAMVSVLATGLTLAFLAAFWRSPWLQAKFALVLGLAALNGYFARYVRTFAADENRPLAPIFPNSQ